MHTALVCIYTKPQRHVLCNNNPLKGAWLLAVCGMCVCRYRPLPANVYAEQSRQHPLIATRPEGVADPQVRLVCVLDCEARTENKTKLNPN